MSVVDMPEKSNVFIKAISQKLDGMFLTLKNVRHAPMQWNTPERKFSHWVVANLAVHLWMNLGTTLWIPRSKARAPVGTRAVSIVEGRSGQSLTMCFGVSRQVSVVH